MPDFPRPIGLLPALPTQAPLRPMFRSLSLAASGLSAQRQRIETIAGNLANADTTRTDGGGPYKRKVAVLQAATAATQLYGASTPPGLAGTVSPPLMPFGGAALEVPALAGHASAAASAIGTNAPYGNDDAAGFMVPTLGADDGLHGVRVAQIAEDGSEGPLVYDPGHPDADANGYVRYPNVRVSDEMIDMIDARRIYEANATVFQSAKAMLKRAIDI